MLDPYICQPVCYDEGLLHNTSLVNSWLMKITADSSFPRMLKEFIYVNIWDLQMF